jgi:hypothetical protein
VAPVRMVAVATITPTPAIRSTMDLNIAITSPLAKILIVT